MDVLAALLPPVAVCAAFVAIVIGVKRYAEKESRQDRERERAEEIDRSRDSL